MHPELLGSLDVTEIGGAMGHCLQGCTIRCLEMFVFACEFGGHEPLVPQSSVQQGPNACRPRPFPQEEDQRAMQSEQGLSRAVGLLGRIQARLYIFLCIKKNEELIEIIRARHRGCPKTAFLGRGCQQR